MSSKSKEYLLSGWLLNYFCVKHTINNSSAVDTNHKTQHIDVVAAEDNRLD